MKILIIYLGILFMSTLSFAKEKPNPIHIDLISATKNLNVGEWSLHSSQTNFDSSKPWHIRKYTLHGGKQEGVELIEIFNGALTFQIIPTRGMNILQVISDGLTLGWDSPIKEVVHPSFVNLNYNNGLGWLDSFNEWMTRCGIEYSGHPGDDDGRELTLHGRVSHTPASEVSITIEPTNPPTLKISGIIYERWFKGAQFKLKTTLTTVVGSTNFQLNDVITNEASDEKEFQILYHANFAKELLTAGSKLHGTIESVQPFNEDANKNLENFETYGPPAKTLAGENVFQIIPHSDKEGRAHFLLHNAHQTKAVSFNYKTDSLPYFTMWKNPDSLENGYVTGLEPGNCFPSNRHHEREQGRIAKLKGGESAHFSLEYQLHTMKQDVISEINHIRKLNEGHTIHYIKELEHPPK